MISFEFCLLFLAFSLPMVCTPGPGNLILAMSGAKCGIKGTLPLIAGIDLTYVVFSVLIGMGLGTLFEVFPITLLVLKYLGSVYLVFLAYKIWKSDRTKSSKFNGHMGFIDGVILTSLNPKAHLLMILMFSQFMKSEYELLNQVALLTIALAIINIPNHLIWSYLGDFMANRFRSDQTLQLSNRLFAIMLIGVAIYIFIT